MSKLANVIDKEMMEQDRKKLRGFEKDIKETSLKNYDRLHMEFLNNNVDLTFDEIQFVKKVFDFLKSKV